jgi:hypothetical protein
MHLRRLSNFSLSIAHKTAIVPYVFSFVGAMAPSLQLQDATDGDVISRIYLIRHGDRFDYANPSWADSAKLAGCLVTGAFWWKISI